MFALPCLANFLNFSTDEVSLCCPGCLPKCWSYRCEPPCLACVAIIFGRNPGVQNISSVMG
uniref:Uncharacterized protein n=1 Tax=Mandrillus leucophaeus TaxID=9568 RepID=A0A2K6AKF7_MANLE